MFVESSPATFSQARSAIPPDTSPDKLVKEYITNCIIEGLSGDTLSTYAYRLNIFLELSSGLSRDNIREYLKKLIEKGLSPSTRNAYYRALHSFFSWVKEEYNLENHPMMNINPPKIPKRFPSSFAVNELNRLFILTGGNTFLEIRNRALVLVFLDTGLRLTEMSRLKKEQVDILTGVFHVIGKGDKERAVRIGKATRKALNKYLSRRTDSLPDLWVSEERKPLTRAGIKVTIVKLCRRAGVKGGPHKIRHTFAVNFLRNGGDLKTLQLNMGHSNIKTTDIYLQSIAEDDLVRVHEKASPVDNLLK